MHQYNKPTQYLHQRGYVTEASILAAQPHQPQEPQMSANEYFEEIASKVMRNMPAKQEKSLDYWSSRCGKKLCSLHPKTLSKTCRYVIISSQALQGTLRSD